MVFLRFIWFYRAPNRREVAAPTGRSNPVPVPINLNFGQVLPQLLVTSRRQLGQQVVKLGTGETRAMRTK
jgi:hypothetical protein